MAPALVAPAGAKFACAVEIPRPALAGAGLQLFRSSARSAGRALASVAAHTALSVRGAGVVSSDQFQSLRHRDLPMVRPRDDGSVLRAGLAAALDRARSPGSGSAALASHSPASLRDRKR